MVICHVHTAGSGSSESMCKVCRPGNKLGTYAAEGRNVCFLSSAPDPRVIKSKGRDAAPMCASVLIVPGKRGSVEPLWPRRTGSWCPISMRALQAFLQSARADHFAQATAVVERHRQSSLQISREIGDKHLEALGLTHPGTALRGQDRPEEAELSFGHSY